MVEIILALLFREATTWSTARLMPRRRSMGFMPAATDLTPSARMARVSTVAVVVPGVVGGRGGRGGLRWLFGWGCWGCDGGCVWGLQPNEYQLVFKVAVHMRLGKTR